VRWDRVRLGVQCAFGDAIPAGAWAAFGTRRGFVLCEAHAVQHYKLTPPAEGRQFTLHQPAAEDVRARQSGGES